MSNIPTNTSETMVRDISKKDQGREIPAPAPVSIPKPTQDIKDITKENLHPGYAYEYYQLKALFENDPDFEIGKIDNENQSCVITTKNAKKAMLFDKLANFKFLDVKVETADIIANENGLGELFESNPLFSHVEEFGPDSHMKAAMFKPECVAFFSDDFFSPTGWSVMTAQDLARRLFDGHINIQTVLPQKG